MPVRVCFVGCGAIARVHAEILRADGAILHTVVGRRPDDGARFAAEFGFQHHGTDLEAVLAEEEVDAVVITSPSAFHYDQAKRALLAGKHVLVEIPLAMSHTEGVDLVELARAQGRFLMVAHSLRFIPSLAAVRQRVVEGSLRVYHLMSRFGMFRRENIGWTGRRRSWTDNLLWHHGCHVVDWSLWFLGTEAVEVVGQVAPPDPRTGIPMDLDLLLRTPAGQLITLSLSYQTHFELHDHLIVGEQESLYFDRGRLEGPEGVRDDARASGAHYLWPAWKAQDHEFLTALREGRPPSVSGADALPALAVLQAVQKRFMPPD